MDKSFVESFQQYFWVILPVIIVAVVSAGWWYEKRQTEKERANAMAAEVDKYDSDEPVGDIPYNDRP